MINREQVIAPTAPLARDIFFFIVFGMRLRLPIIVALLASVAASASSSQDGKVTLVEPFETVTAADDLAGVAALSGIAPDNPEVGWKNAQTFSLFGREDLIAATSSDYRANTCAAKRGGGDVVDAIVRGARATSVVIVNESHERSEHRGFTTTLLARLRGEGYTALGLETLQNPAVDLPAQYLPAYVRDPRLPYFERSDGYYLKEAGFGRLGRTAKRLGYTLVPYEQRHDPKAVRGTRAQEIAAREEAQATALAAWLRAHPGRKLVVHVGYSHAREVPAAEGDRWMALRLREKTGIDPLTISQTTCRGGGDTVRLAELPATEPRGSFDLVVDHPTVRFARGRPVWRQAMGDLPVTIPAALRPARGWRVIEARRDGEPVTAVPMDRVAIRPGEDVALMLPPGAYRLRTLDPPPPAPAAAR